MNQLSNTSLNECLNLFKGKNVTVLLLNGTCLSGRLKEGVDYTSKLTMSVHIEKLEREDFYDCVISKDVICAIKFRPDD